MLEQHMLHCIDVQMEIGEQQDAHDFFDEYTAKEVN